MEVLKQLNNVSMKKYKTPDGTIFTESEARAAYGDLFEQYISDGSLTEFTEQAPIPDVIKVSVSEDIYYTPDGSEISEAKAKETYGEFFDQYVLDGSLKKKGQSFNSTKEKISMGGTVPLFSTTDTLLDSGKVEENNLILNTPEIDGISFAELEFDQQKKLISKLDNFEQNEENFKKAVVSGAMSEEDFNKFKQESGLSDNVLNNRDVFRTYLNAQTANGSLSFNEQGRILGKRKTPAGVIATEAPRKRNFFNKLFYSEEDIDVINAKGTISKDLLDKVDVDLSDYQAWERENTKEDEFVYSEIRDLLNTDEDEQLLIDKRNFQKLSAYTNSLGDDIQNDIALINDKLKFETNPNSRTVLLSKQKALKEAQVKNIGRQYNFLSLFPSLQKQDDIKKLRRKEYIMNQREGDFSGATSNIALKTPLDSGVRFLGGLFSAVPSWIEQGGNLLGSEMSGFRAVNESFDAMLNNEVGTDGGTTDTSPIERAAFNEVKEVTINWQGKPMRVGLTPEGDIVDMNTMVSMGGLLTNEQVKEVNDSAKNIPEFEITYTGGSIVQGATGMAVNLIGLIKSGKWATKTINKGLTLTGMSVKGGIGMGAVSYAGSVATEVNSIKNQLMQAGIPEQEAMDRAIFYGNGKASLDGLFSGLAGANTKLLVPTENAAAALKDLVLNPKILFKSEVFKGKVKDVVKENFKEVFIEELPVLYTGAFLNKLANESVGKEILNQDVSKASVIETVVLTLGATSALGSRTLLTNNGRKDLLRAATESSNIEKDIADAINNGLITEAEGKSVYTEVYNMQTGINQTQGTILVSSNIEPAAALLEQRRKLMAKRAELEGPLKLEIDKKIEGVDSQIDALKKKDIAEAKSIINQQKEVTVTTTVTKEEALASLKAENEVREKAGLPLILESKENILKEQDNLIKEKTDAVQKSETEEQVLSDDGTSQETGNRGNVELQGVGKGDARKTAVVDEKKVGLTPNTPDSRGTAETYSSETMEVTMISTRPDGQPANTKKEGDVFRVRVNKLGTDGYMRANNEMTQSFETVEEARNYANKFISRDTKKEQQAKSDKFNESRDQKINEESRRFVVPGTKIQVQMNADGTANPVAVKENTDKQVNRISQLKANKMILEDIIDVNEGTRLDLDTSTNLTESEYSQEVADNSNNIKEVAETLAIERKNRKNSTKAEKEQEADPLDIKGKIGKITEEEFIRIQGESSKDDITPQMRRFWFKKKNKYGQSPKSELDTKVMELDGYTQDNEKELMQKVIDFIIANPTGKLDIELGISNVETSLENKFEQLTGLKATPINIQTVNNIDPNREPISETQEKSKLLSQKEASEPGVFSIKKKGPSPDKILGKKKTSSDKTKEESENVNRKKFWKSWNKSYRESKKDQDTKRKQLSDAIESLRKEGTISMKKAISLIKKISGVNLNNPRLVSQVLEYVTKVSTDASNAKKFDDARNLSGKIKKLLKSESLDAEVAISAKQFNKIDPNLVTDLDLYLDNAQKVINGLTKTKTDKEGNLIFAGTIDIKGLDSYTTKEMAQEAEMLRDAEAKSFSDLTGLDPSEFSIAEMRSILEKTDSAELDQTNEQKANEKNDKITKAVKKAFAFYKKSINDIIKNRIDPISGDPLVISKADKKVIKDFMEVDIDLMTTAKEKLEALDAMVNFIVNQGTGGMVATTKRNEGMKNIIKANKLLKPAKTLKLFGSKRFANNWFRYLGNTPMIMENMFKGTSTARVFNRLSGFDGFRNGVAKAETITNKIAQSYVDKFITPTGTRFNRTVDKARSATKTNPNGEVFNSQLNDVERFMYGQIIRTVDGTKEEQKIEFDRRKRHLKESIAAYKEDGQTKQAELAQKVYDKIISGSNSIQDVENKVDPVNKEAVEWMVAEWSKVRPELENVSLNIYNKVLGKDINYTTDSYISLKGDSAGLDQEIGSPQYRDSAQKIYDKKTGVLIETTRPSGLPVGRVLNLSFDSVQLSALKDALIDIETAESIQVMKGFLGTSNKMNPAFKVLVPDAENRKLIFSKFQNYVNTKRGASEKVTEKETIKLMNKLAGIGVSRVLGGPTQIPKQLVPLFNTATNLMFDLGSVGKGISLMTSNPDAKIWLSNSGYEIANRGLQSVTNLEGVNTKIDRASEGTRAKVVKAIVEVNKVYLEKFLVSPDKFAAQASWMAYYMNNLKKQGIDPSKIDWSNHKVNKEAGAFAEQQVGRQQNVSDVDLQGDLFKRKSFGAQFARKTLFPFANFLTNQKTRMYTDVNIAFSKTATKEDKRSAYLSLAGLGVETAIFNSMGLAITQGLAALSQAITGDDDDEANQKSFKNRVKGRAGNVVTDILSPIPIVNDQIMFGVNKMIEAVSNDEDPFQFFANDKKTFLQQAGVLGIEIQNAVDLFEMVEISTTGLYKDKYGKTREVDPSVKGDVGTNAFFYFLYGLGVLPSEAGSIIKYNVKSYKKSGNKSKKSESGVPVKTNTRTETIKKRKTNSGGPLFGGKKKSGGSLY